MKTLQIALLFLSAIAFGQQADDLYIIVPKKDFITAVTAANDSVVFEDYRFSILTDNPIRHKLAIDKSGKLSITRIVKGKSYPAFRLTYKNIGNDNPPIEIDRRNVGNIFDLGDLPKLDDAENFYSVLNSFQNIYIIEKRKDAWLAKKAILQREPGL